MARSEIVALGADNAVGLDTKSLWIVPELWKTQETRFPQARWTRTERAPTRSTGIALFLNEQEKKGLLPLARCCWILSPLS
jgi:hypothetical protein